MNEPITAAPAGGAGSSARQRTTKLQSISESPPAWLHLISVTPAARLSFRLRPLLYFNLSPFQQFERSRCASTRSEMLACTEMITMCLQSAKQKHLRAQLQQQPLHNAGQGLTIFHDVSGSTVLLIHHHENYYSY